MTARRIRRRYHPRPPLYVTCWLVGLAFVQWGESAARGHRDHPLGYYYAESAMEFGQAQLIAIIDLVAAGRPIEAVA